MESTKLLVLTNLPDRAAAEKLARTAESLERIVAGSTRMNQMIDDILACSRAERTEMRWQTVDLGAMAADIADHLRHVAKIVLIELGQLTPPMRARFGIVERFEYYAPEELTAIVRRSEGRLPDLRTQRLDVTLPLFVEVVQIYNLACPASPPQYQARPVQTTLTSVLGLWHLLELSRQSGARVFQASTSEVYGDPQVHPQTEDYVGHVNPIGPRSCYDEGKRCGEAMCFAYHRQYAVPIRVARIFNSYGPRLRPGDGRVVSNFIVQALTGQPITVYGDGTQTRSFCYVDDLVEGFLRFMDTEQAAPGPLNLGNPGEFTILALAEQVVGGFSRRGYSVPQATQMNAVVMDVLSLEGRARGRRPGQR